MSKKATVGKLPENHSLPRVDFDEDNFNSLIRDKGYTVTWEKAIPCPCSLRLQAPQSSCLNCLGTGWVYINPEEIKAVLQNINSNTKYREWSQELIGTVSITLNSKYRVGFMDKIKVTDSISTHCETLLIKTREGKKILQTIYPIKSIEHIYLFTTTTSKLIVLEESIDYTIEENMVVFLDTSSLTFSEGSSISIRYSYNLQYNIIDINHEIRNSYALDDKSREKLISLPISVIGRKSHYILDSHTSKDILDNSTTTTT